MACYTKHLTAWLEEAGLPVTPETKRQLHRAVKEVLVMPEAHCPEVWSRVKERRKDPEFHDRVLAVLVGPGR